MIRRRRVKVKFSGGSALILAVVLTSLLATIGMIFVMIARVDKIATSAVTENKELEFAVDTVISKISQELVLDVNDVTDPNTDYYDYPDFANRWLASLEPYKYDTDDYRWRQISDVTGYLTGRNTAVQAIQAMIVGDHDRIIDPNDQVADADGDGVADSKWIKLSDITSGKGEAIYAAVRVVDNGGMLNVNTAYTFDPNEINANLIDGSSQMQVDLLALAERGSTDDPAGELDDARFGDEPQIRDDYIRDVVWRYDRPNGAYTPFDISDELELRNRFLLNHEDIDTRIELVWNNAFQRPNLEVPVKSGLADWFYRAQHDVQGPNDIYSYKHLGTIYNMERIINPIGQDLLGGRMANINRDDVGNLYSAINAGILDSDPNLSGADTAPIAAQIAVNIKDYRDGPNSVGVDYDPNDDISSCSPDGGTTWYYGFERPCVYISELAQNLFDPCDEFDPCNPDLNDPNIYVSYAIELYKPYAEDNDPNGWRIEVAGNPEVDINWTVNSRFHVLWFEDANTPTDKQFPIDINSIDPNSFQDADIKFIGNSRITLRRPFGVGGIIVVDEVETPPSLNGRWLVPDPVEHWVARSFKRDINPHKCIGRLWDYSLDYAGIPTFGQDNGYEDISFAQIQAHPANEDFTNVGEIGMVLARSGYCEDVNSIGRDDTSATVLVDLANANYQQIFNYLTVFDPTSDGIDNDGDDFIDETDPNETVELKVAGRININTAPWYVMAQLPWVRPELAQTIVGYRERVDMSPSGPDYSSIAGRGFKSTGELNNVFDLGDPNNSMRYYAEVDGDLDSFPDLTAAEGAIDDFEERDIIFHRISNLVTVRSDVFTAYILVRIGEDGPQKRVVAILDRSDVYSDEDKVKLRALHLVPDPR